MKHISKILKALTVALTVLMAMSIEAAPVDTMTGIFDEHFRTLQVTVDGDRLAPPIIVLGTDDRLVVTFDELADDRSYLRYSLIHCNANWQPSGLVESEFVEGFNLGYVEEWDYSRIAVTNYIHYTITLPNEHVRFLVSGNYLLQVFNEDDPDTIILQARFMVSEATAEVRADVLSVTDIDYNDSHQQVSVEVDTRNAYVEDPFNDLMVCVSQNGRYDNEVMVRQPLRLNGTKAVYEHLRPLIFDAGNEYRRMEIVSTDYPGMHVAEVGYFDPYYHATLTPDLPRSDSRYEYDQTQHGRFFIREYNSSRPGIEADYVVTHFSLEMPEIKDGYVFLDGDFTGRRFDPESLMTYNRATGRYEKSMLLKQGAYNYQYLVARSGRAAGSTAEIEGNHFQTDNEYLVKVYHRRRGERYDRLIGVGVTYFRKGL